MARKRSEGPNWEEREKVSREILRSIGDFDPFADADPDEVEKRLRSMSYGATNSRVSKLRRAESDPPADR